MTETFALENKAFADLVWENVSRVEGCANTPRPLAHPIDLTDRQDEMKTTGDRFWSKVTLPDENGCMLWLGTIHRDGYAQFWLNGKMHAASRVSLILTSGAPSVPSLHAAHACRNRHCVAPLHLSWATPSENSVDKQRDGTTNRGGNPAQRKLSPSQVLEIRRRFANGETSRSLGAEFGVYYQTVQMIGNRRRWGWLTEESACSPDCNLQLVGPGEVRCGCEVKSA